MHIRDALVGRSSEMESIDHSIGALKSGRGHLLMLTGEPGIGKSTLARYAAERARQEDIAAYWGFAWEAGGAPPYWPWTQLLSSLVDEQELAAGLTAKLQQLLPAMEAAVEGPGLQPHQARFQLMESVRRLLENVSHKAPVVLIFEDLHAADSESLQMVHYIARHVAGMPVFMIGTFRDVESRAMPESDVLWHTCRDAEVLALERLDQNDVRDFLEARDSKAATDENVQKLFATTEGNPLFLTELVGLLARRNAVEGQLPANVQQVIRQQVALLPKVTASLLSEAAVLGREFDTGSLEAISALAFPDIQTRLAPAMESGLIRRTEGGKIRFSHALHRDVLYEDLGATARSQLHREYSKHLKQLIDNGDEDRWAELAEHLRSAGGENHQAAIAAWRSAARRATKRLAFDDAVSSMHKALRAVGEGPRYSPADRYELLLECARPSLLVGDTETGHRHCRDAFEIARTLQDARMMSEAALVWGSAIVVARVDAALVAALRESLAALSDDEVALRARVLARLAGAMQPAPNPAEPMDMAREAITLARSTGDDSVMYEVLRSAISALMDFAPAAERIPLNEEFGVLAEKFGDVPGRFRSKLRLMIDACEAGDRSKMDQAIDDCQALAERIALPHYLWRASSARAMQATIDGDFARATSLLDSAEKFADQFDDLEAKVTLPMQRFMILIEWDSGECEPLERIESRLQEAFSSGMGDAEFFAAPFIESHKFTPRQNGARRMLTNQAAVERTFRGGDRYTLCRLGETAVLGGDEELGRRVFERVLPHRDQCATLGLMGSCCTGPVAWSLGLICSGLGKHEQALELLEEALGIAESMRAPPWIARIHADIAGVARAMGQADLAHRHETEAERLARALELRPSRIAPSADSPAEPVHEPAAGPIVLGREGELWRVSYGDQSIMLRDSKGLGMLAMLIARPENEIHVLDLSGASPVHGQKGTGPEIDAKARSEYKSRIRDLREELEEAEELGDIGHAEAARAEMDFITRELSRAFGLAGKDRPTGDAAERARVNVRRRLKDAIERISEQHPAAGRYLENTIKTGIYCRYMPM